MDIVDFLRRPDLWRRPVPDMPRSTQMRIYKGITDPKVGTAQAIVEHANRHIVVTSSTLTPLPLPRTRARPAAAIVVPVFATATGELVGNFHSMAVHHRANQGGTVFLAMMSLIATGIGWETWVIDPKGTDASLYFPECTESATGPDIPAMLARAASELLAGVVRPTPLLISVDLADHVLIDAPTDVVHALCIIIAKGPAAGVFINLAITNAAPVAALDSMSELLPVHLSGSDYTTAVVAGLPCHRPQLFIDYILSRDDTDIDYRRYLAYAKHPVADGRS